MVIMFKAGETLHLVTPALRGILVSLRLKASSVLRIYWKVVQHKPARQRPAIARLHVDWVKRDEELAGQIATIATHIKNHPGRLNRVTVTAIGRALGKQSLFEAALAKLPLTRSVIESVLESDEDFAVRRIHSAARKLRMSEGTQHRNR